MGSVDDAPHAIPHAQLEAALLRSLLDESPEAFYLKDLDSRFVWVSSALARAFHAEREDVIGKTDADFYTAEHAEQARADEMEIIRSGVGLIDVVECETWADRPNTWAATTKLPLRDASGAVIGTWGLSRQVTDRIATERMLAERTAQLEALDRELSAVLDGSPDAMVRLNLELRHMYVNPAARTVFGEHVDEVIGQTNREMGHPLDVDAWEAALHQVISTGVGVELEFADFIYETHRWFQARMVPEYGAGGRVTGVLAVIRDLTERKQIEEALAFQAVHDPLTGLANRVLLLDRVGQAIGRLERNGSLVAVLFVDLDRFKAVNDTLGHAAGDWLLLNVAERLHAAVRPADTVARFGGDEFVVLCEGSSDIEAIRLIAERVDRALSEPFVYEGLDLHVTGSVGVATTTDFAMDAERLVADADTAMYEAKERGGARHHFYDTTSRSYEMASTGLELELRNALDRGEFRLHYQPRRRLSDDSFLGVEALIRWEHPHRGLVLPAEFLDVAERSSVIVDIGVWTINEACRQLAAWAIAMGEGPRFTMAVNVSGRQFANLRLAQVVADALARHDVDPALLCLEVSETSLFEESATAAETFGSLAALGVQLALDDFGTGHSTIAYLQRFPISILKIDRSLVSRLTGGAPADATIVAAFTAMAHALGITTVGEGIENAEQLDLLRSMGCDEGQGYLFSRPVPPTEMLTLLLAQQAKAAAGGLSR